MTTNLTTQLDRSSKEHPDMGRLHQQLRRQSNLGNSSLGRDHRHEKNSSQAVLFFSRHNRSAEETKGTPSIPATRRQRHGLDRAQETKGTARLSPARRQRRSSQRCTEGPARLPATGSQGCSNNRIQERTESPTRPPPARRQENNHFRSFEAETKGSDQCDKQHQQPSKCLAQRSRGSQTTCWTQGRRTKGGAGHEQCAQGVRHGAWRWESEDQS